MGSVAMHEVRCQKYNVQERQCTRDMGSILPAWNMMFDDENESMPDKNILHIWLRTTWASVLRNAANSYLLFWSQALDKDLIAERPTLLRRAEVADLQAATSECIQREAAEAN